MNLFDPYRICGDANTVIQLSDEAAAFAVQQGYGTIEGTLQSYNEMVPPPEPVGTLQKMNFAPELPDEPARPDLVEDDSPIQRALDDVPEPVMKKPDGRSNQKTWAAWAVQVDADMTLERAEGMSKQELMAEYGQRW